MLPPGHITMDAFSIDSEGRWYIAGSSDVDNVPFLWRVSSTLDSYEVLAEGDKFIDIQVSLDGSAVFAVTAKSAIRSYDTALKNEYDLIEAEDTSFSWSGVAYDDSTGILFAAASKKNAVYQYTQGDGQWSARVLVAGNPSGEALDTADGLNNPTVVRWYDGYLFIRVFDGVWQWKPFDSAATQTFGGIYVYGQRGLTVSPDNFVYYSKTNNKVYRKPISNPPDGPDRTTFPGLLPPGQITTESFSFTNKGVWYLAGYSSADGIRTLWRIECNSWVYVAQKDLSNIEASGDNMYVFGISEGAIVVLNPKNSDSFVTIAPADPLKEYTGVAFDSVSHILYVTEKATGDIARFTTQNRGWKQLESLSGSGVLVEPTILRYTLGKLYVRINGGIAYAMMDGSVDPQWSSISLDIQGDQSFTAAPDGFLYYRKFTDSVYRLPLENPVGPGELYAGGCGCGLAPNQVCTSGNGNLVNYKPTGGIVMQDYFEGPDFRFLNWCGDH
ncbi:hypothetical protein FOL46_001192, partial [Perkinsus olseni]